MAQSEEAARIIQSMEGKEPSTVAQAVYGATEDLAADRSAEHGQGLTCRHAVADIVKHVDAAQPAMLLDAMCRAVSTVVALDMQRPGWHACTACNCVLIYCMTCPLLHNRTGLAKRTCRPLQQRQAADWTSSTQQWWTACSENGECTGHRHHTDCQQGQYRTTETELNTTVNSSTSLQQPRSTGSPLEQQQRTTCPPPTVCHGT